MGKVNWDDYSKVALDANCFIYLIEGSVFMEMLSELFHKIEKGDISAVASSLTITEILTGAYQSGDSRMIEEYRTLLKSFPNLKFRNVDWAVADRSAELRALQRLKTPDSIHLATAIVEEADVFVTHDSDFHSVDFPVILLSKL